MFLTIGWLKKLANKLLLIATNVVTLLIFIQIVLMMLVIYCLSNVRIVKSLCKIVVLMNVRKFTVNQLMSKKH